ncbi:hypothetical protein ZWY2020_033595 [Hordeum vulgare]|nr:hypothetical protein ZWY2020_033595 [Hordeum vulgare]
MTYKGAGVDIDAGTELVPYIRKLAPRIGGFGGLYPHGDEYLVDGTDGVRVQHDNAKGPMKGGIRYHHEESVR